MHKILLVEDDESFVEMVQTFLVRAGYEVIRAHNGEEALRLYQPRSVDLVLTDLVMPEKEGTELIMDLRRLDPDVKIIAISGGGRGSPEAYVSAAQQLGASITLVKPFDNERLLESIRRLIPTEE